MAGCSRSWHKETNEKINYTKLCRLLVDGGTQAVCGVFDGIHPPSSLKTILNTNKTALQKLKKPKGKVLNNEQWDKLYPPSGSNPKSEDFDITLLFVLLRNIKSFGLKPPVYKINSSGNDEHSWDELPLKTENSNEANLVRIKYYRNNIIAHKPNTEVNDVDFKECWQDISKALLSLGLRQVDIDDLKSAPLEEKDYNQLLYDWFISDKDIKTQLDDMKSSVADVKSDTTVIKSNTDLLPGIQEGINQLQRVHTNPHIDQLAKSDFSSLIEMLCKTKYHPNTRQWILSKVKSHVDRDQPESCALQITAGPGMGKSVLAAKICQTYDREDLKCVLGGCHFFQFSDSTRNDPRMMLQSIARQMCDTVPCYEEALGKKLQTNLGKDIRQMSCEELFTVLFEETCVMFDVKLDDSSSKIFVVVLDAIDECCSKFKQELKEILNDKLCLLPSWIQFVITTRPPPSFSAIESRKNISIDPKEPQNKLDLENFFKANVKNSDDQSELVKQLVEVSDGLFLVAFFLINEIKKENITLTSELKGIFPNRLSSVYEKYLKRLKAVLLPHITEEEQFFKMLEAVVASKDPIPIDLLYKILGLKNNSVFPCENRKTRKDALSLLHSLFPVENDHVGAFHKSLVDFLIIEEGEYGSARGIQNSTISVQKLSYATDSVQDSTSEVESEIVSTDTQNNERDQNKPSNAVYNEKSITTKTHDFSVCVEDGDKLLADQCYDVLSDIRNGEKVLDKPLDLTDSQEYALRFVWDRLKTRSSDVRRFLNYFLISAMVSYLHNRVVTTTFNPVSDDAPENQFLDVLKKCSYIYSMRDHTTGCPFANRSMFGSCVELVLQVANMMEVFKEATPNPLELLKEHKLSYCEMKTIKVVDKPQGFQYQSILVCENGFLFVYHNELNTVVMKCPRHGELSINKELPGKRKVCVSPNRQFIVVIKELEKGEIEVRDEGTLELVAKYQSPNVIRSCHVFGDQPWYIVARCYNNKIYVMEGEAGTIVSTIAGIGQYLEVEAVSNLGHILLGTSNRYVDNSFTDVDGNFSEEMIWPFNDDIETRQSQMESNKVYERKLYLCHFNKPEEMIPIYPTRNAYCCTTVPLSTIIRVYGPSGSYGESVGFSQDGRFLAFHYKAYVFIRNTSDCSLYKKVYLGCTFNIYNDNGIAFLNKDYVVVHNGSEKKDNTIMVINVHTNEIVHRYYCPTPTSRLQVLPKTNSEPFTFITERQTNRKWEVLLYVLHNLDIELISGDKW